MDKDSVTAHVACATVFYSLPGAFVIHNLQVDNGTQTEVAALYNMSDNTFVPFHIPESPFCSGHTLLPDGRGLVIGGEVSSKTLYTSDHYIFICPVSGGVVRRACVNTPNRNNIDVATTIFILPLKALALGSYS